MILKSAILFLIIHVNLKIQAENILDTANLVFFYGKMFEDQRSTPLSLAQKIPHQHDFDLNKKTVLYIFGYVESMKSESVQTVVSAYQKRSEHNILVLDWTKIVARNYAFQTLPDSIHFSKLLADAILSMFSNGINRETFHIVAHSLGCQLASMTARNMMTKSSIKIKRISALDPAFPLFYPGLIAGHLSESDAEFVDVIHTDAFLYGAPIQTGTADFWPNGGTTLQNGCPKRNFKFLDPIDLCSHWRSWQYWAESVASSSTFQARKCDSWKDFSAGLCKYNDVVTMGQDCPENIKGNYYLQTNDHFPFARGVDGVHYMPDYKSS